jgi:hypothetical protein
LPLATRPDGGDRRPERQRANDVLRDGKTQIDCKLEGEPWHKVGSFASYGEQMRALHLKPWQFPPVWVSLDDDNPEHAPAVALLRRLLDNNLSKYEPSPLEALAGSSGRRRREVTCLSQEFKKSALWRPSQKKSPSVYCAAQ